MSVLGVRPSSPENERGAGPAGFLWTWLAASLAMATAASVFLVVDRRIDSAVQPIALGAWWWLRILAFHGLVLLLSGLGICSVCLLLRRRAWIRPIVATGAIGLGLALIAPNVHVLRLLARLESGARPYLVAAIALSLLALAIAPLHRLARRLAPLAATLAVAAFFAGLQAASASRAVPAPPGNLLPAAGNEDSRLLVLGLDGADWTYIDQMFARGELPVLRRLRDNGIWGPLETIRPTQSPTVWTTIVTGRRPPEHGIQSHTVQRHRGARGTIAATKLRVRGLGLESLRSWLESHGQLTEHPVTASERRVPAIWNISTFFKRPLSIVSWWATWPAEPILGRIVTDRLFYYRTRAQGYSESSNDDLTFPASLRVAVASQILKPDDVTFEHARRFLDIDRAQYERFRKLPYSHHDIRTEFPFYLAMFESDRRFGLELMRQDESLGRKPGSLFVLFRLLDHASHCCLGFSPLVEGSIPGSAEGRQQFGRMAEEAYRAVDEAVGQYVDRFGDGNVVLLSDHGFRLESTERGKPIYHHKTAPPGIFLAAGPAFRQGRVESMTVYDMFPLFLHLLGLPVPESSPGRLRTDLFTPEFSAQHPQVTVPDFDFVALPERESRASKADEEILEELRALGYIG